MVAASPADLSPPHRRWWSLCVVALAVFMVTTDYGLLSISLPIIITEFKADLALAGWIALIYALVTGSLYLPCGKLSDLVGRKATFSAGFLLYGLSSLVAGLSQGAMQLVFLRALQAVGSALMMANTFALVTSLFPPAERGRAMGISGGTVSALGYTLGPVLGGLLTHVLGWRSIFFVTAGLGLAGFAATRFLLPDDRPDSAGEKKRQSFDLVGTVAFAVGLSAVLLALTTGQKGAWHTPLVRAQFIVSMAALAFFVWWEGRARFPLLDLRLFRIRAFAAGNVARLVSFVTISMNNLLMPFFLQLAMGLDPLRAGFLMAPTPLALAVLSPVTGWLSEKIGARLLSTAGLLVKGAAFFVLSFLSFEAGFLDIILRLGLLGIGFGLFQTPNNNSLMSSIPRERVGVGSAFLSIVRSLGQSVGAALATTIVSASLVALTGQTSLENLRGAASVAEQTPLLSAFLQGFRYAYWTAAVLCCAGAIASSVRGPLDRS